MSKIGKFQALSRCGGLSHETLSVNPCLSWGAKTLKETTG